MKISSVVAIRVENKEGFSELSDTKKVEIVNGPTTTLEPSQVPSTPRILTAIYDAKTKSFYLRWLYNDNGSSNLEKLSISFLQYDTQVEGVITKGIYLKNSFSNI